MNALKPLHKIAMFLGHKLTQILIWTIVVATVLIAVPLGFMYLIFVSILVAIIGTLGALFNPRKNCRILNP